MFLISQLLPRSCSVKQIFQSAAINKRMVIKSASSRTTMSHEVLQSLDDSTVSPQNSRAEKVCRGNNFWCFECSWCSRCSGNYSNTSPATSPIPGSWSMPGLEPATIRLPSQIPMNWPTATPNTWPVRGIIFKSTAMIPKELGDFVKWEWKNRVCKSVKCQILAWRRISAA